MLTTPLLIIKQITLCNTEEVGCVQRLFQKWNQPVKHRITMCNGCGQITDCGIYATNGLVGKDHIVAKIRKAMRAPYNTENRR